MVPEAGHDSNISVLDPHEPGDVDRLHVVGAGDLLARTSLPFRSTGLEDGDRSASARLVADHCDSSGADWRASLLFADAARRLAGPVDHDCRFVLQDA